jgi:hypothetical protein
MDLVSKFLVHHTLNGAPVGVWSSDGTNYYPPGKQIARAYGEKVLKDVDFSKWDEVLELWSGRTPNTKARWSDFESDAESLEEVFLDVQQDSE